MIRIALYQPDIAQNTGTILRLAACLGLGVDIVEPAGFPVSDKSFRRSGMDYLDHVQWTRHDDFAAFEARRLHEGRRLVLMTTRGALPYADFAFREGDMLMAGRESAGVPPEVHAAADGRILIPMQPAMRSLNVAVATAMVAGEALRQLGGFPPFRNEKGLPEGSPFA
jgi:tRNA (cytidine/uridine-2'-O-)-methyltransferase